MGHSVEAFWQMSQTQLLVAYHDARLLYAEKKFARDTERGRLQWLRARAFVAGRGTVTERMNVVDASDELARKGQHVREMSHGLDLLKSDIDIVATTLRLRGFASPTAADNSVAFESGQDEQE
jgi:hypothetical protein